MKIIILGAGVIGVTSAYYLMRDGHEVTVIDRQSKSASECSFANGGQLSYSHVEPWASPSSLKKIPYWMFSKHSPLVFAPSFDIKMWRWSLSFLRNCTDAKVKETTEKLLKLSLYSKSCFEEIEQLTNIAYNSKRNGIIHVFKDKKMLEENKKQAQFQKEMGCDFEFLSSRQECENIESALKYSPMDIAGGIHFTMDGTGDANEFTSELTKILIKGGVEFLYNTNLKEIELKNNQVSCIKTDKGDFVADCYVAALGVSSPLLLDPIGVKTNIYPMKGYSISVPITNKAATPSVSVTDQENKIVFSRLGDILRVAGTAEFAGYDDSVRKSRIKTIKHMARLSFPDCGDIDNAKEWAGLRPSTPSGIPVIGASRYNNLFINTGHGTLGWTLSCGSASVISDLIAGRDPKISQ